MEVNNSTPRHTGVSKEQIDRALAAGLEVLKGAQPSRILELSEDLSMCKLLLRELVDGRLVLAQVAQGQPETDDQPAQPQRRRSRSGSKSKRS